MSDDRDRHGPDGQPGPGEQQQYGRPQYGQQPQFGQQPPAQPGYPQPGYPQQAYPPPGYPQQAYPPQGYPQQQAYPQPEFPPPGIPPVGTDGRHRSRTAIIVTVAAVVLALVAGGGIYLFAHKDTQTAGGQTDPQQAVSAMLLALSQKDPVGVVDQLDPVEASLYSDLNSEFLTQLKRLEILRPTADASTLTGTAITVTGLTYAPDPDKINDHVTVVKLTGGTVTVSTDASKLPLTDKIRTAVGTSLDKPAKTQTYSIADEVRKLGHPIRIATVDRDGKWYPSLFYTAADSFAQEAKLGNPTAADFIKPAGGSSPEDAMNQLLSAATSGDYAKLIALLPPREMAVMHDYGNLLTSRIPKSGTAALGSVKLSDAAWTVSDVAGGKLVSLQKLTVTTSGVSVKVSRDAAAGSLTVAVQGQPAVTLDKDSLGTVIKGALERVPGAAVTPQLTDIVSNEFGQLIGLGVVMTQDGGQWFASPTRTSAELFVSLLKGLQPSDIDYFLSLAKK